MKKTLILTLLLSLALSACGNAAPANTTLILATTTSTQDSGLLDLLVPLFEEQSSYTVQTIAVVTAIALKMAEEVNAVVLSVQKTVLEI